MTLIDENHPLAQYLEGVVELEELLSAYNIVSTEEVLRNAVAFDHRPLVIHGSTKRLTLAVKKVQPAIDKIEGDSKPPYVKGVESKELQAFINSLRVSQPVTNEEELLSTPDGVVEVMTSPNSVSPEGTFQVPTVEVDSAQSEEVTVEEPEVHSGDVASTQPKPLSVGRCQYGVLVVPIEYQEPNVLGLKESLVESVDEESIKEFFSTFSKKVANSTNI